MALSDKLRTAPKRIPGPPCTFRTILSQLGPEDRAALQDAVDIVRSQRADGGERTISWLWRCLTDEGFQIGLHTVNRHINRFCSCEKE